MEKGIKGFRFDVINLIGKPKKFKSTPDYGKFEYTDKKSAELHIRVEVPPTFLPHRAGVLYAGALRRHRSGYLNTEGCPVYQKHV